MRVMIVVERFGVKGISIMSEPKQEFKSGHRVRFIKPYNFHCELQGYIDNGFWEVAVISSDLVFLAHQDHLEHTHNPPLVECPSCMGMGGFLNVNGTGLPVPSDFKKCEFCNKQGWVTEEKKNSYYDKYRFNDKESEAVDE